MTTDVWVYLWASCPILLIYLSVSVPIQWWPGWVGFGVDGREAQEGEDLYIHVTDSLRCIAETNMTLESNHVQAKSPSHV